MKKNITLIFTVILILTNCAYYNTFHNARKFYKLANEAPVGENGRPSSTAISNYNKAIKKCGVILTEYKNSKYADDALFMLAKCFFYKRVNYIQAMEKFNDLVTFYPQSEYVPEAKLYYAESQFLMNNKTEAYQLLHDFITNPEYNDLHAEAHIVLADYYLEDENYTQAQNYFRKLIDNYPDSKQYGDAFFRLGMTFHNAEDYEKSNEIIFSLLKSKVERRIKLNARALLIENYLNLGEFQTALETTRKLLDDEYRLPEIPKVKLLLARSYAGLSNTEEAGATFDLIIENNKKTDISAEAYYYSGEMYFHILNDFGKAIEQYNKVAQEKHSSKFVKSAVHRSAIASKIIQYNNPNFTIDIEELIGQQLQLAEYYYDNLNLPDSAFVVYDNIIRKKQHLISYLDSLQNRRQALEIAVNDSLISIDSLLTFDVNGFFSHSDQPDSLLTIDSLAVMDTLSFQYETTELDSFYIPDSLKYAVIEDSLLKTDSLLIDDNEIIKRIYRQEMETLSGKIEISQNDIEYLSNTVQPQIYFIKFWLKLNSYRDSTAAQNIYLSLEEEYPENSFTNNARSILSGIDIEDEAENELALRYRKALDSLQTNPDITISRLSGIAKEKENPLADKAAFAIGYIKYFILSDSLTSKAYFDSLLITGSRYNGQINQFYDGNHFKKIDRLPYLQLLLNQEKTAREDIEKEQETENEAVATEEIEETAEEEIEESEQLETDDGNKN